MPAECFVLPGVWRETQQLVLHHHPPIALLQDGSGEGTDVACPLTPQAFVLLQALLQAFPEPCPYAVLAERLPQMQAPTARALRNVRAALLPALAALGLRLVALRSRGYVLAAAGDTSTRCPSVSSLDPARPVILSNGHP